MRYIYALADIALGLLPISSHPRGGWILQQLILIPRVGNDNWRHNACVQKRR